MITNIDKELGNLKQISKKDILILMHQLDELLKERQEDKFESEEINPSA